MRLVGIDNVPVSGPSDRFAKVDVGGSTGMLIGEIDERDSLALASVANWRMTSERLPLGMLALGVSVLGELFEAIGCTELFG